ncbi:hypothetical protein GCM10027403_20150 [Arthrobacter tecti]
MEAACKAVESAIEQVESNQEPAQGLHGSPEAWAAGIADRWRAAHTPRRDEDPTVTFRGGVIGSFILASAYSIMFFAIFAFDSEGVGDNLFSEVVSKVRRLPEAMNDCSADRIYRKLPDSIPKSARITSRRCRRFLW